MAATASGGSPSDFSQSGSAATALDVAHHVLDARVILEPVHREVLAVARELVAAVGHLGHERDVAVDPHAAEVESLRHPQRAAMVLGPHARRERERDAVGPADRLVLVAERLHGDHRAEDLVLDQLVVLAQAIDDRRLVEVPALALALPAGHDGRVVWRALDEAAD